jgi:16S rRNA (guanine966-N2)-methyltransferase
MRIVAGEFRGRTLATPKGSSIRPTSDRLREALFNVLAHGYDDPVAGARVIDLFAGTGALGLEALSRGAQAAVFVDDGAEARGLIRANVDALGLGGRTRLFRRDATKLGERGPVAPFSLAFLDPPYGRDLAGPSLVSLAKGGWLVAGALAVVEESSAALLQPPAGFIVEEVRHYGDTSLTFLRFA